MGSCEQNGVPLGTPVSDSVFIDLSDGTFLFSLQIVIVIVFLADLRPLIMEKWEKIIQIDSVDKFGTDTIEN